MGRRLRLIQGSEKSGCFCANATLLSESDFFVSLSLEGAVWLRITETAHPTR